MISLTRPHVQTEASSFPFSPTPLLITVSASMTTGMNIVIISSDLHIAKSNAILSKLITTFFFYLFLFKFLKIYFKYIIFNWHIVTTHMYEVQCNIQHIQHAYNA